MNEGQKEYRELKKAMGWTNSDVAEITGLTEGSVAVATMPNTEAPKWAKLGIEVFKRMGNGCNWKYDPAAKD